MRAAANVRDRLADDLGTRLLWYVQRYRLMREKMAVASTCNKAVAVLDLLLANKWNLVQRRKERPQIAQNTLACDGRLLIFARKLVIGEFALACCRPEAHVWPNITT